jgi:hypothetical protein
LDNFPASTADLHI